MVPHHNAQYLAGLVSELRQLPRETEWVEFKANRDNPQDIGEYISALANGAALNGKNAAHILWGIADGTHAVIGTDFNRKRPKGATNRWKTGCGTASPRLWISVFTKSRLTASGS